MTPGPGPAGRDPAPAFVEPLCMIA